MSIDELKKLRDDAHRHVEESQRPDSEFNKLAGRIEKSIEVREKILNTCSVTGFSSARVISRFR